MALDSTEDYAPNLSRQERYWDWWQDTRSTSGWALQRARRMLAMIEALVLEQPRILDFGCGDGWFAERLARLGTVTGIDLSTRNMAAARVRCPHIEFIGGDLFQYAFSPASFDIVVSMQVIAHVEDQRGYIERCAHLVRPRGYLLLSTLNRFVMDRLGDMPGMESHRSAGHIENWLDRKDVRRLLRPSFELERVTTLTPIGQGGVLRLVNSYKCNRLLGHMVCRERLDALKGWAGLGYTILALARRR